MFRTLIAFSVLLLLFINCQPSGASFRNGNAEEGTNVGNKRNPSYENHLLRRYHGPGMDFAVRRYPVYVSDQVDSDNHHEIEVNVLVL